MRQILDRSNGELLFELSDETIQVEFEDVNGPQSCDLYSFSPCGNVYDPVASTPYKIEFSPSGNTLAVLYRPEDYYNSNEFSTLRVYSMKDGGLLSMIGSFEEPVEDFTYSSDGESILVGFVDGSIQLWEIPENILKFSTRSFNAPIQGIIYSFDGRYVIIRREGMVEVRSTFNGSLIGNFEALAVDLSPIENRMALGTAEGIIRIYNLDSGIADIKISAHHGEVYALAFNPDGTEIASFGLDCTASSWDVRTGEFKHFFDNNVSDPFFEGVSGFRILIYYLSYIPDTDQLLGYGSWGRVVSWDVNNGQTQYFVEPEALDYYNGMMTITPHFPSQFRINLDEQVF